jgi:hypothetical protein
MLSYTLEGPTNASGDVNAEQVGVIAIRPGHYKIKVTTQCEFSQFEDTYATGLTYEITYSGC